MSTTETTLLRTYLDSGAPPGSLDYTTLFVVHGLGYHAGIFKKLLPLAHAHNARVVAMNRRDYPGSVPFTPEERAALAKLAASTPGSPDAVEGTSNYMKARARELYDYLAAFVVREKIPRLQGQAGGIVIAGWSLGATWLSALLTHVASFPTGDVNLRDYVRRVVYDDPSAICHGFPSPDGVYHPLYDKALYESAQAEQGTKWVGSYFEHGDVWKDGAAALESRKTLEDPPPTTTANMTREEAMESMCPSVMEHDASETLLAMASMLHGEYRSLKEGAFYLRDHPAGADDWRTVETRWVWGDRSVWEMPWGARMLGEELAEARAAGKHVREVKFVRFRGANHFAHWDFPEKTLRAFLEEDVEEM